VRQRLEYALLWPWIKLLAAPRSLARAIGITLGLTVYAVHRRLRHVGQRNLTLAFLKCRPASVAACFVESSFPWTPARRSLPLPALHKGECLQIVIYDGFENFERAYARGKGPLPDRHLAPGTLRLRPLPARASAVDRDALADNPTSTRDSELPHMHGNRTVDKDDFVRGLLSAMKAGETVGILMDTNMTPPQGVFVILRHSRLHRQRSRPHRAAHRRRRGSRLHRLG